MPARGIELAVDRARLLPADPQRRSPTREAVFYIWSVMLNVQSVLPKREKEEKRWDESITWYLKKKP